MKLFHDLNEQGTVIVIVTNDPEVAKQYDRIIEIPDVRIV